MVEKEMKLPGRETLEAYISKGGFICLKQGGNHGFGGDSAIIAMLPSDIPTVIAWLRELQDALVANDGAP